MASVSADWHKNANIKLALMGLRRNDVIFLMDYLGSTKPANHRQQFAEPIGNL
jgi:hypothetical protein